MSILPRMRTGDNMESYKRLDSSWEGGRPAGERHAKDFFGKSLYVGDIVATLMPNYRYTLVRAIVHRITPKMLRVRIYDTKRPDVLVKETTVAECQVVKHWRQGP